MLETAVRDSLEKLRFQEEVAEAGGVNTNIAALCFLACCGGRIALLRIAIGGSSAGGALSRLQLLVGIIDEIFLAGRHDGRCVEVSLWDGEFGAREAVACSSRVERCGGRRSGLGNECAVVKKR